MCFGSSPFGVKIGDRAHQRFGVIAKQPQTGIAVATKPSSKPSGNMVMIYAKHRPLVAKLATAIFGRGAKRAFIEQCMPFIKGTPLNCGHSYLDSVYGLVRMIFGATTGRLPVVALALSNAVGMARFVSSMPFGHAAFYMVGLGRSSR